MTTNAQLAVMEWEDVWEPGLPMAPATLGQDDQQQLLWGFPSIDWEELEDFISSALDLNTRMFDYLFPTHGVSDLTTMMAMEFAIRTGSATERYQSLIADVTL